MVTLRRVCDGVMAVDLMFEDDVLRLICGYAQQSGGNLEEDKSLW